MAIGFNEDITSEILLRLPVKSILRFKTVSKQWLSIVSCRRFRKTHTSGIGSNLTATGLFFPNRGQLNFEFDFDFVPLRKPDNQISPNTIPFSEYPINIRSSSSGLLLLRSISTRQQPFTIIDDLPYLTIGDPDRVYFVCNPTTKEFKPLAVPQHIRNSPYVTETLAFDPSKSPHYKVVFVYYHEFSRKFQIEIYSSETATFSSPATNPFTSHKNLSCFCGIYCNDAIHWISFNELSFYYFDLNRECMNELRLPTPLGGCLQYFGESRGHLHLVIGYSTIRNEHRHFGMPDASGFYLLDVYELKKDYSDWSLKYRVDHASIAIAFELQTKIYVVLPNDEYKVLSIFFDEEEDLTMVLAAAAYGMFVVCNFKKQLCNVLRVRHNSCLRMSMPISHQYIETLACV